jgi:hypothetical protein
MTPAWLLAAFTKVCEVYARAVTAFDEYGNPVYGDLLVGTTTCALSPMASGDLTGGRTGTSSFVLYLPAESAALIDAFSLVRIDGFDYEVDGPPSVYTQLFTPAVHHVEVNLTRSTA